MVEKRQLVILGATGSIGGSTLNVVRENPDLYEVYGLTGHTNLALLELLVREFHPSYVAVTTPEAAQQLGVRLKDVEVELLTGLDDMAELVTHAEVNIVVAGIVGTAGVKPTLAAARAGKQVLLANKESMVMAGPLFRNAVREHGCKILPIDSEHNAIFQALPGPVQAQAQVSHDACRAHGVEQLILTASGGPFLAFSDRELLDVTPAQACQHPNWSMGAKVSVDSASLMNKGLELIEACYLFGVSDSFVEAVIHPQSIVHSMVAYIDGSMIAHFSSPRMEIPIAHGLAWPDRHSSGVQRVKWHQMRTLEFIPLDQSRFPCFQLARAAMQNAERNGSAAPVVLNGANEEAVASFLAGKIAFVDIPKLVERCLEVFGHIKAEQLNDILLLDQEVKRYYHRELLPGHMKEC